MVELVNALLPYVAPSALPLIIVVLGVVYIQSKRKVTAVEREKDSAELHDSLLQLKFQFSRLEGDFTHQRTVQDDLSHQISTLSESVAKFSVAVDMLADSVKDIRNEIRHRDG